VLETEETQSTGILKANFAATLIFKLLGNNIMCHANLN